MSEILIPIACEFDSSPELDKIRESAADKVVQILNLGASLEGGVKMWHGIEYPLLPAQIKRREDVLSSLQRCLTEDLDVLTYSVTNREWFEPIHFQTPYYQFNAQQVAALVGRVETNNGETLPTPQA